MSDQLMLDGVEPAPASPDFAALRNERGWSMEEVAEKLKISVAKVRAIEALDFAALPDRPYARGFVRNYARLLDVDASPWLNLIDTQPQSGSGLVRDDPRSLPKFDDTGRTPASSTQLMWWGVAALALAMLLFLAWWERASWLDKVQAVLPGQAVQSSQPAGQTVQTVEVPVQTASPTQTPASGEANTTAPAANDPSGSSTSSPSGAPGLPMAAAVMPGAVPNTPAAKPELPAVGVPAGHKAVALSFKSDAWVEVRDASGKSLVSQLNKAGSQTSFTGQPPLRFVVGSARDVAVTVDGKNFDLGPHVRNEVARFVVN
jgi:cytoskeleton protein RodZ